MTKKICLVILIVIFIYLILNMKNNIENFSNNTFPKPTNWKYLKFTDKLKIYGTNLPKEYSLYADKYEVKEYINNLKIQGLNVAKTLKTLDINNDILDLSSLPRNCIIKTNNGYNDIIIIKNGTIKIMNSKGRRIKSKNYYEWKKTAIKPHETRYEKHYKNIETKIFVEEYLGDNINDYKFFCLKGKIIFLQVNKYDEKCKNIYDVNFNLLPIIYKYKNCSFKIEKPKNLDKMIKIVEKLSKKFEFVRVDLYNVKNKIYFGEFTFIPHGGGGVIQPNSWNTKISNYWNTY